MSTSRWGIQIILQTKQSKSFNIHCWKQIMYPISGEGFWVESCDHVLFTVRLFADFDEVFFWSLLHPSLCKLIPGQLSASLSFDIPAINKFFMELHIAFEHQELQVCWYDAGRQRRHLNGIIFTWITWGCSTLFVQCKFFHFNAITSIISTNFSSVFQILCVHDLIEHLHIYVLMVLDMKMRDVVSLLYFVKCLQ